MDNEKKVEVKEIDINTLEEINSENVLVLLEKKDKSLVDDFKKLMEDSAKYLKQVKSEAKQATREKTAKEQEITKEEEKEVQAAIEKASKEAQEEGKSTQEVQQIVKEVGAVKRAGIVAKKKALSMGKSTVEVEQAKQAAETELREKLEKEKKPTELTLHFVALTSKVIQNGHHEYRPALIAKFKSILPKKDMKQIASLIDQNDNKLGFKKELEDKPLTKLFHMSPSTFKNFYKAIRNKDTKLKKIAMEQIKELSIFSSEEEKKFWDTLNEKIPEIFDNERSHLDTSEDKELSSAENKLKEFYPFRYKEYKKINSLKDVRSFVNSLKKCDDMNPKEEKVLTEALHKRFLTPSEQKLKNANRDLYKKFIHAKESGSAEEVTIIKEKIEANSGLYERDIKELFEILNESVKKASFSIKMESNRADLEVSKSPQVNSKNDGLKFGNLKESSEQKVQFNNSSTNSPEIKNDRKQKGGIERLSF